MSPAPHDAAVLAYLDQVFRAESAVIAAPVRARLASLREELEAAAAPDYTAVAAWRLLASNSLAPSRQGDAARRRWDAANEEIARAIAGAEPTSVSLASRLHAALGAGSSETRRERIFTADEEYLSPHSVAPALARLDVALAAARDPFDRAFRAYVGVVTIHPFENGNGRAARLLADHALLSGEWLPLCFASPIASHVAMTAGGARRDLDDALAIFARGVENAYLAALRKHRRTTRATRWIPEVL